MGGFPRAQRLAADLFMELSVPAATAATQTALRYERLGILPWLTESRPDGSGSTGDTGSTGSTGAADHDPRSSYVETFWLPILGPSTTLLIRRFARQFQTHPSGFEIDGAQLSKELGLGTRLTQQSPFVRTINRCVTFNLAEVRGEIMHVRQRLPTLSIRQVSRLSPSLRAQHPDWVQACVGTSGDTVARATGVARSLLALGEPAHMVELQLQRWHFAPAVAGHATQLAARQPT